MGSSCEAGLDSIDALARVICGILISPNPAVYWSTGWYKWVTIGVKSVADCWHSHEGHPGARQCLAVFEVSLFRAVCDNHKDAIAGKVMQRPDRFRVSMLW